MSRPDSYHLLLARLPAYYLSLSTHPRIYLPFKQFMALSLFNLNKNDIEYGIHSPTLKIDIVLNVIDRV